MRCRSLAQLAILTESIVIVAVGVNTDRREVLGMANGHARPSRSGSSPPNLARRGLRCARLVVSDVHENKGSHTKHLGLRGQEPASSSSRAQIPHGRVTPSESHSHSAGTTRRKAAWLTSASTLILMHPA